MEADRFDRIARGLAVAPSRRDMLGLAVGSVIGLLGWEDTNARKKGKKKKCGDCGSCQSCVKGKCKPQPDGTACGGACEECRSGACAAKADGTDCGNGNVCHHGNCGCDPGFVPCGDSCVQTCAGGLVLNDDCQCACPGIKHDCGGGICRECCNDDHCGEEHCCEGTCHECCDGDDCSGDRDCENHTCGCAPNREECGDVCCAARRICVDPGNSTCVTGRGTCEVGANHCLQNPHTEPGITCNAQTHCFCFQTLGGDTRCAQPTDQFVCAQCAADADCEEFGPGAFCVDSIGPSCCGEVSKICAVPCDTDPPGACPVGADGCANVEQLIFCNGSRDCLCLQVAGETRCLTTAPGSACDQCTSDEDCDGIAEGAICFIDDRLPCSCGQAGKGFCMVDCPDLDGFAQRGIATGRIGQETPGRKSSRSAGRRPAKAKNRKRKR